ncbi:MAG: MFS transporter [Candidatus Bipolaricaulaceae bacterium]
MRAGIAFLRAYPDLGRLFWSNVLWTLGSGLYFFVWPNYVRDLGGGPQEIGYLTGLMYGVMALSLLPGGWLADRAERRRLMVANWGLAALAPLLFALARHWTGLIPGVLLYAQFFGWPAMEAYVADLVPKDSLGRAFALANSGYALGAALSPLLGAALLPRLGMRGLFFLAFLAFLASTLVLTRLSPQRPKARPDAEGLGVRSPRLWPWMAVFVGVSLASAALRPFLPVFLEDRFGMARAGILASGALLSLGGFVLAWPLGHFSGQSSSRALAAGLLAMAAGVALLFLPFGFLPGLFLFGADAAVYSLLRGLIGREAGWGRVFGATQVPATLAQALAPLAAGWLYHAAPTLFLGLGAGFLGLLALVSLRLEKRG